MASALISQRSSLFLSAKVNWSYLNLRFHISSFLFQGGMSPTRGIMSPIKNVFKRHKKKFKLKFSSNFFIIIYRSSNSFNTSSGPKYVKHFAHKWETVCAVEIKAYKT